MDETQYFIVIVPLIKWAGGKRQILPEIERSLPESWNTYIEPFSGGLAVFCYLAHTGRISKAILSDTNPELINLYRVVRDQPEELLESLSHPAFKNTQEAFYENREWFNSIRNSDENVPIRAALFLYLNRHCFNGLWRVNNSGLFNVPFGRYKSPALPTAEHIRSFSTILQDIEIRLADFSEIMASAQDGDFVYCDPPYQPVSDTAKFTSYTGGGFSLVEQKRLADAAKEASRRGVFVLLSNSDVQAIHEIYNPFHIRVIGASRMINRDGAGRTGATEVLASTYLPPEREIDPEKFANIRMKVFRPRK